jgi:hypothetical protein
MISKATVHKATVLMNRRMNTERRVTTFGPVCSSVAGMAPHHLEGRHGVQERAHPLATNTRSSRELLSGHPSSALLWIAPAINESAAKAIDRRPIATRNRKDDCNDLPLGMLVSETNVPVVPCGLIRRRTHALRFNLIFGESLNFAATPNNREGWSQIARSLESRVRELAAQ